MNTRHRAAAAVLAVGAAIGLGAVGAAPASAAGHNSGTSSGNTYCVSPTGSGYAMCFYYSTVTGSAAWGMGNGVASSSDANLGNNTFDSGLGGGDAGNGQVVRNNSANAACGSRPSTCYSYVSPSYVGNYDYYTRSHYGRLYYTWNNNASARTVA